VTMCCEQQLDRLEERNVDGFLTGLSGREKLPKELVGVGLEAFDRVNKINNTAIFRSRRG
jgi:hypothetical protein